MYDIYIYHTCIYIRMYVYIDWTIRWIVIYNSSTQVGAETPPNLIATTVAPQSVAIEGVVPQSVAPREAAPHGNQIR